MIWAPRPSTWAWVRPLTVPWLATGMKAGVSTVPWGVSRRPVRAAGERVLGGRPEGGVHGANRK